MPKLKPPQPAGKTEKVLAKSLQLLDKLPFRLRKALLETLLNQTLAQPLKEEEFAFMEDRGITICLSDLQIELKLRYRSGRLLVQQTGQSDTCIRGALRSFLCLLAQHEDPDSLFFQRRLMIEGDTELGLGIKNLLDSLDWEELPQSGQWIIRLSRQLSR